MSTPIFIQNQKEFESLSHHLSGLTTIALDTEFDNNHFAYGFTLCLIQIATPSGDCFLIDPFTVSDLNSLWKILENPTIEKVLHDSGEDMRLFYLYGCRPKNIFDTSVACKLLNFEKIGLGSVLNEVFGIESNKKKQQSNWLKRPLIDLQLEYAANDVIHLLSLRDTLAQQLQNQQRWQWFGESMKFLETKTYASKPKTTFLSHKELKELSPFHQHILNELYRFRDEQAQIIKKPVYQVISEKILYDILYQPDTLLEWMNLKGIHYRIQNPFIAHKITEVYQQAFKAAQQANMPATKLSLTGPQVMVIQQRTSRHNSLKESIFLPIKRWIEQQHGSLLTPYILSNEMINILISGESKLSEIGPLYQQSIIKQAADALAIDLSDFE